ncbi:hypothetical protein RND71_031941 [Anisodus tanguticus]|uniref:Uncharacterized protein n=1 Tax=Anisodus tanguticus TaxID=243964 RepID=A0AAE1RC92_9SOLA|nr:hypothetical protein RND71_031941 [Anisodus tanguticus]
MTNFSQIVIFSILGKQLHTESSEGFNLYQDVILELAYTKYTISGKFAFWLGSVSHTIGAPKHSILLSIFKAQKTTHSLRELNLILAATHIMDPNEEVMAPLTKDSKNLLEKEDS